MKIASLPELITPAKEDELAIVDNSSDTTKRVTVAAILNLTNPIGTVYVNTVNDTNPSALFGFGEWTPLRDRVLVGVSTTGTFSIPGRKVGSEDVTLTVDQLPSHNHPGSTSGNGAHSHSMVGDTVYTSGGGNQRAAVGGSGQQFRWGVGGTNGVGDHSHSVSTENRGGNQAHSNIQPTQVVYMWERVA